MEGGSRLEEACDQRVVEGDCLRVMADMALESVDVVVTSPPYNLDLRYASYQDNKADADYIDWICEVGVALSRVLKPEGSCFLNLSGSGSRPWLPFETIVRLRSVFFLQNHITWIKSIAIGANSAGHYKPVAGKRFLHHTHEHVFHLTKTNTVPLDRLAIGVPFKDKSNIARRGHARDLRCRGNAWFIPYRTVRSKAQKFNHPGTFPVELPLWCLYLAGMPSPVVLDPFAGSGSTLVAAARCGARAIGIEIDPTYVHSIRARLAEDRAATRRIVLDASEMACLVQHESDARKADGWVGGLQDRLNKTTGQLALTAGDLEQLRRHGMRQGAGAAWAATVFGRTLGLSL